MKGGIRPPRLASSPVEVRLSSRKEKCPREDLNLHPVNLDWNLNPARLPVPPLGLECSVI